MITLKRLSKEISQVVDRVDVRHGELAVLDTFANEEVSMIDMLDAFMMLRVVGEIYGGLVVAAKLDGVVDVFETQLGEETIQRDGFLSHF